MSDRDKLEAVKSGVFLWMADRPISVLDSIEDGARRGMIEWLDANRDAIIKAIADAHRGEGGGHEALPAK